MARVIDQLWEWIAVVVGLLVILGGVLLGLVRGRGGRTKAATGATPTRDRDVLPGVGDDAEPPRDAPKRSIEDAGSVDTLPAPVTTCPRPHRPPTLDRPDAPAGRLQRLRARLARSNTALGQGLLALLSRGKLDEEAWEEVEDTLIAVRPRASRPAPSWSTSLRSRVKIEGTTDEATVRGWLREDLLRLVDPTLDRTVVSSGSTAARPW